MSVRKVDLTTICGGGLPELFARELRDVMANITDINTDPKKPRRITMTVDVYPSTDRATCALELGITSKHAPIVKMAGSLFIAVAGETLEAYTSDLRQQDIFDEQTRVEAAPVQKPYILQELREKQS